MDYTITIPDDLDIQLQRFVRQFNSFKGINSIAVPNITATDAILLWVLPNLQRLQKENFNIDNGDIIQKVSTLSEGDKSKLKEFLGIGDAK